MLQFIVIIVQHPILAIFFVLPSSSYTRAMKAMIVYVMLLLQFYGQMLFWGTGNEGKFVMIWACIINSLLVWMSEIIVSGVFATALLKPLKAEPEPGAEAIEELNGKTPPSWELVCRQTARSDVGDPIAQFEGWKHPMLLGTVKAADQFYSDKLRDPRDFRSKTGHLVCKLVYSQWSWRRYRPRLELRWSQSSLFSDEVVTDFQPVRGFLLPASFEGLRSGISSDRQVSRAPLPAAFRQISLRRGFGFHGREVMGNHTALHQGGGESGLSHPIFLVGQAVPGEAGALTGQDAKTGYHRLELFMMQKSVERRKGTARSMMKRLSSVSMRDAARHTQYGSEELLTRILSFATDGWDDEEDNVGQGYNAAHARAGVMEALPAQCLLTFPDDSVGFFAFTDDHLRRLVDADTDRMRARQAGDRCPTFVRVLSLSRVRLRGSGAVVYKARYDKNDSNGVAIDENAVQKDPMALYRALAQLHWSRMLDG
eukprot:916171-Prymnesium_polylepis.1